MNPHDGVLIFFLICVALAALGGIVVLVSKIQRARRVG